MRRSLFALSFIISLMMAPIAANAELQAATTLEENLDNVVKIWCGYYDEEGFPDVYAEGSGVVIDENLVLTNAHVAFHLDEFDPDGTYYFYDFCWGGIAPNSFTAPEVDFFLDYTIYNWNNEFDYSFMEAVDDAGEAWEFETATTYGNADSLIHGDEITLVGYPTVGGDTITSTFGNVAGFEDSTWIKTDAVAEFGSSGGGAFDGLGNFVGLPTIVSAGDLNSFTLIQNVNAIIDDAFEAGTIVRDFETLYTYDNVVCFFSGDCYNFGEGDEVDLEGAELEEPIEEAKELEMEEEIETVEEVTSLGSEIVEGAYEPLLHDQGLINRLTGYILLQVDLHGEAWYINPDDGLRYYMKNGAVAYEMMRSFGLGITDADLAAVPIASTTDEMLAATSVCTTNEVADRLKGDILLQVEQHGEAWWVHPETCHRIYMKDGEAAYEIMRFLSTGITSGDLAKMPTGDIK